MAKKRRRPSADVKRWFVSGDYYEYNLLAAVILLVCFGLIMLYSTSAYICQSSKAYDYNDMFLLKKQAYISLGGFAIAIIISKIDYHVLAYFSSFVYITALFLMGLVITPLGEEVNGAKRWLKLGPLQFQPSELAKIAIIICTSYLIVQMGKKIDTMQGIRFLAIVGGSLFGGAFVFTQNLSTAIIIIAIGVGIVFLAHPQTEIFLKFFAMLAGVVAVIILFIVVVFRNSENFRVGRIVTWLDPAASSSEEGYQVLQGLYAIGSGGMFGKGLGNSVQKLGPLPEAQNDMIFTVICEELGIFGICLILILFAYLLYRIVFVAMNAPDLFGSLLVSGVFIHISLQVILNIAVSANVIPNTGVTLPFFSYGGTSILFLMAEIGMVLSVANQICFQEN